MAGWSVETQRESKRPKEVMAERVHDSRGTLEPMRTVEASEGQIVNHGWVDNINNT